MQGMKVTEMRRARLRRLPWSEPDGRAAYTPDDCPGGRIAQLADEVEESQVKSGRFMAAVARDMLGLPREPDPGEAMYVIRRLAESLEEVLLVAESRGERLPVGDDGPEEPDEDGDVP
jgi:hypothetical protein